MSARSIKKYLDKETAIAELRLLLSHPKSKNLTYVVVEGTDDSSLMKKFFDEDVQIIESYSGCQGVKNIVLGVFTDKNNVIGICDMDYNQHDIYQRIFFYDYSTWEIMVLSNHDIFDSLCCEYYKGKLTSQELYIEVFERLKIISLIREENHKHEYGINFNVLRYAGLLEAVDWNGEIVGALCQGNTVDISKCIEDSQERCSCEEWLLEDYLNNTNGHDFLYLLKAIFQYFDRKLQLNDKMLSSIVRCSYTMEYFKESKLYANLKSYEEKNGIVICKN